MNHGPLTHRTEKLAGIYSINVTGIGVLDPTSKEYLTTKVCLVTSIRSVDFIMNLYPAGPGPGS